MAKKKDFSDDFAEDTSDTVSDPPVSDDVKTAPESVTECSECKGTGAVPDSIVKGRVDTWKNCAKCYGKGKLNG